MSIVNFTHRLIDGPLVVVNRKERVEQMAAALIEAATFGDERDAIRSLIGRFTPVDVMMLVDDARQVAVQSTVAREMSAP